MVHPRSTSYEGYTPMQWKRLALLVVIGFGVAGLTACYESPDITLYEPGEYKGKDDPLLAESRSAQHEEELRERLMSIQTDR